MIEPTRMDENVSLSLYLRDISKTKALKRAEEVELAKRIHEGDQKALEKLVKANLRFVVSVAGNYRNQGLPMSDLINEGNCGLIRAAKKFDEKKNFKFISYAVWWVRQAILQALANQSRIMKLPLTQVGTLHKILKARSRLEQKHNRLPSTQEIATELELRESAVQTALRAGAAHKSLDAPLSDDGKSTFADLDLSQDEESFENEALSSLFNSEISQLLDGLEPLEKEIVQLYFGIGKECTFSLDDIGAICSLPREKVTRIKSRALEKLKKCARSMNLRIYN
ncbi:MAG: sigma-70 family RNA polymerase sigma factor [Chitinivibrionales bacterium]|nr:sigma-70 family RNA polymerase sigma factor [Chitinivibrionales bacterium]